MVDWLKRTVETKWFQYLILTVIVVAAVLVGVETYPEIAEKYHGQLELLNQIVLWIFVVEAAMKMGQHGKKAYRYFADPWNVFDFLIVVVCFLPVNASYAAVLRLARIMRALRLMTALPSLQVIVGALIKSIPSMGYVGILLALNFYVYAVMGVFLFRDNDPIHFRDLQTAMLSLFRVVTLEDWTDVMYINMYGSNRYPGPMIESYQASNSTGITPIPSASPGIGAAYFVSFVMFGTMIMLNLFIGVILNSMEEARGEQADSAAKDRGEQRATVDEDIEAIEGELDMLRDHLQTLRRRLRAGDG